MRGRQQKRLPGKRQREGSIEGEQNVVSPPCKNNCPDRDSGRGSDGEDRSPTGVALPLTYISVNCMQGCGLHHKRVRVDQT